MNVGTRSLLFGVHQFAWHPLTVALAWHCLYRCWPTWREAVCIVVHDWGYLGSPDMDGDRGERHPELGARIADALLGPVYGRLVLFHSRHYARRRGVQPSRLCWADKLSILVEPWWLYLPRARLSGELAEYRRNAAAAGAVPLETSDREWFAFIQDHFRHVAETRTMGWYVDALNQVMGRAGL